LGDPVVVIGKPAGSSPLWIGRSSEVTVGGQRLHHAGAYAAEISRRNPYTPVSSGSKSRNT